MFTQQFTDPEAFLTALRESTPPPVARINFGFYGERGFFDKKENLDFHPEYETWEQWQQISYENGRLQAAEELLSQGVPSPEVVNRHAY